MKLDALAARSIRWTSISSCAVVLSDLTKTIVLAHYLSPLDYGLMALVGVIIGFAQMYTDLGISAAIIHKQHSTQAQLSSLYWLNILLGGAVFLLVWSCAPLVPVVFGEPRLAPLMRVMPLIFLIAPIGSQFEILLQRDLCFHVLARWEIIASFCGTAVAIGCAIAGMGSWALVFALLTNVSVKTVLLLHTGLQRFRPTFHLSPGDVRGYLSFGFFQMGERSINYVSEKLDQLVIGRLLGAETLGYYNFALYLTAQPISRINPILTRVAFPFFSKVQNDSVELKRGYLRVLGILATLNAPLLIGLAAVAPWAVPAIFGAKWAASVPLVQILSFVGLLRSIGNPIGSLQLAKGRADLGFWWNVVLFLCSLPAILIGARLGGAIGVAASLLGLQFALTIPAYLFLVKPLLGRCAKEYVSAWLKPVTLALLMGSVLVTLPDFWGDLPARSALAIRVFFGALIYVSLLSILNRTAVAEFRSVLFSRSI